MVYYTSDVFEDVELIGECDAVAGCDGEDFMLAVAVEGCPLDRRVIGGITAEIEESLNAFVSDAKVTALMWVWQADN